MFKQNEKSSLFNTIRQKRVQKSEQNKKIKKASQRRRRSSFRR
jgi:hypothetical protein